MTRYKDGTLLHKATSNVFFCIEPVATLLASVKYLSPELQKKITFNFR